LLKKDLNGPAIARAVPCSLVVREIFLCHIVLRIDYIWAGRRMVKVDPSATWLVTSILPPWAFIIS